MGFVRRSFGTLFFLALICGLAIGAVMAQRGMQVDLGSIGGVKLALAAPAKTQTPLVPAGLAPATSGQATTGQSRRESATPGAGQTTAPSAAPGAAQAFGRGTSGTVQQVSGKTITITAQDGSLVKATASDTTTYVKSTTITAADIKVGDTVTVIGQSGSDGAVTAQQVTVGAITQGAAAGGFARQGAAGGAGGAGAGGAGGQFANMAIVTGSVQKVEGSVLTVAVEGGQASKVTIGADARLLKTAQATLADVTAGTQITVTGQTGADGSINAVAVQITASR